MNLTSHLNQLADRMARVVEFKKLDLGKKYGDGGLCSPPVDMSKRMYYPSVWIDNAGEELDDLPDTGKAVVEYRVTRRSQEERDGKKTRSVSIDVLSLDPEEKEPKLKKGAVAKLLGAKVRVTEFIGLPAMSAVKGWGQTAARGLRRYGQTISGHRVGKVQKGLDGLTKEVGEWDDLLKKSKPGFKAQHQSMRDSWADRAARATDALGREKFARRAAIGGTAAVGGLGILAMRKKKQPEEFEARAPRKKKSPWPVLQVDEEGRHIPHPETHYRTSLEAGTVAKLLGAKGWVTELGRGDYLRAAWKDILNSRGRKNLEKAITSGKVGTYKSGTKNLLRTAQGKANVRSAHKQIGQNRRDIRHDQIAHDPLGFVAVARRLTEFAPYGERVRDGAGRYIADETGGADPTSMRQAYGRRRVPGSRFPDEPERRKKLVAGSAAAILGTGALNSGRGRAIGRGIASGVGGLMKRLG